jgi:hypothetical protein
VKSLACLLLHLILFFGCESSFISSLSFAGEWQGEDKMHVKTYKTLKEKIRTIHLLSPPHNSTLTPGVVTFSWDVEPNLKKQLQSTSPTAKKTNLIVTVEKISSSRKKTVITRRLQTHMFCESGKYRWKVGVAANNESRWRLFSVITLKTKQAYNPRQFDPENLIPENAESLSKNEKRLPASRSPLRGMTPGIDQ